MSLFRVVGATCLVCFACGGNVTSSTPSDGGLSDRSSSGGSSGSSGGGSSGGSSGSSGSSSGSSSGGPSDAQANPLDGKYTGYIESYMFPDGSDVVVMQLTFAGGTVTGTVYFGTGAPLAPPTDPSVGYPPGYNGSSQPPFEGFDFTILTGTYAAPRVQLSIAQTEIWKQWCQIQTTIYPWDNGNASDGGCGTPLTYACLPNGSTMGGTSCAISWCQQQAWTPVDCGKLQLCSPTSGPCTCTATSCTLSLPSTGGVAFDMQLASGALDGSVTGLDGQVHNVHLMR
jgi:hypothetical protein